MEKDKKQDVSAARSVAFDILRAVLTKNTPLDDALAVHDGLNKLPRRDRGFTRSIVSTTLRRLGQIDAVIEIVVEKPLPQAIPSPAIPHAIQRAEKPTVSFYRFLYDAVGRDWGWEDRKKLSDSELKEIMQHKDTEVYVLYIRGDPAGYAGLNFKRFT